MNRKQLEQYGSLKKEVYILEQRLKRLHSTPTRIEHAFVKGSNPDFPYEPKSFHVSGYYVLADAKKILREEKLNTMLDKKIEECEEELLEIQDYINSISDSCTRVIFTMTFIDGLTQEQVAKKIHMDRSSVAKRITKYLGD